MTLDEIEISKNIRKILEKEVELSPTELKRRVLTIGKGSYGETAVWKTMRKMVNLQEIDEEELPNRRKNYRLTDTTRNATKQIDKLYGNLENIEDLLNEFHDKYANPQNQNERNYLIRLHGLQKLAKQLAQQRSIYMLCDVFPVLRKQKSWKRLENRFGELEQKVRGNGTHQKEKQFYKELIYSMVANQPMEEIKKHSDFA